MPTVDLALQLVGTLTLRPYVFGFLAIFLIAGVRDLGRARAVGFLFWGGAVADAVDVFDHPEDLAALPPPVQVFAASACASSSKPSAGLPGTVAQENAVTG